MASQRLIPYGFRSLIECLQRALILSQPDDTPKFLSEYMAEMLQFKDSNPEADANEVIFQNQEEWGKFVLLLFTQPNIKKMYIRYMNRC